MAATVQALQAATRDQYQILHNAISQAREVCTDDSRRDDLRQMAEEIQAVLTSLDEAELQSRTADFQALGNRVKAINSELQTLKAEINKIVDDVAIATKVTDAINGALSASFKLFA
jgi:chromosome segregation ATPase